LVDELVQLSSDGQIVLSQGKSIRRGRGRVMRGVEHHRGFVGRLRRPKALVQGGQSNQGVADSVVLAGDLEHDPVPEVAAVEAGQLKTGALVEELDRSQFRRRSIDKKRRGR
jgi:hypothetical protein